MEIDIRKLMIGLSELKFCVGLCIQYNVNTEMQKIDLNNRQATHDHVIKGNL